MDKKNILVIGSFAYKLDNASGGQTLKVRNLYRLLEDHYKNKVSFFDTWSVRSKPWLLLSMIMRLIKADVVVAILAQVGLERIFPIIYRLSKVFRYQIIFVTVGGWQVEFFLGMESNGDHFMPHPKQLKMAKKIKAFLPETSMVYNRLKKQCGFCDNIDIFPNFRYYDFILEKYNNSEELKLVFCARIDKYKGYDMIFKFLDVVKEKKQNIKIDFYGPFQSGLCDDFMSTLEKYSPSLAEYKGVLMPNNIYETLNQYDILLFPTHYYNEGFPGTILDAYIAGIPVIATEWVNSHVFIKDGVTGYIVPFDNGQKQFEEKILELYNDRSKLQRLKEQAYEERLKYDESVAWRVISKYL